jgi:carboxymethylenebutenolidase
MHEALRSTGMGTVVGMCFDHDSTPPIPAGDRPISTRELTLTASDGSELMAFEAVGDQPSTTGVIVLPDIRGLFQFYKDLASLFAQSGHDAVAIDYFGRTAGPGERTDDWDYRPHVEKTTLEGIRADVAAAVEHLRTADPSRRLFTVGFCFGGSNSWHQAASGHGLAGAVGFYGRPRRSDEDAVIDRVAEMECPILALMGGADQGIPVEVVREFETALDAAGVRNEVVIYPNAPHSFFDRKFAEFGEESADAWRRVLDFVESNAG